MAGEDRVIEALLGFSRRDEEPGMPDDVAVPGYPDNRVVPTPSTSAMRASPRRRSTARVSN